jgi:hypothetical protein
MFWRTFEFVSLESSVNALMSSRAISFSIRPSSDRGCDVIGCFHSYASGVWKRQQKMRRFVPELRLRAVWPDQGCQIFLGPNIPKREKYNKWSQAITNDHKLYQIAIKCSKWSKNIPTFTIQWPSKMYPNLGFLVWKQTIWQPWTGLGDISPFGETYIFIII